MNIVLWLVFGLIVGAIGAYITGSARGIVGDIIVGILGAFLGGWISTLFGGQPVTGFNLTSLIVAVLGAVVLTWIVRMVRRDTSVQA